MQEPIRIALVLLVFGTLLAVSVMFSRASDRFGIPIALIFMIIGMLAGSDGPGGIRFADYHFAFRVGTVGLIFILFDGGLNTSLAAVRRALLPAGLLATVGVVGTAAIIAGATRLLFGVSWPAAMLVGAIVSSTDAAAVFSVLRGSGIHLKRRVGATLELESGLNDPMAVILTTVLTANLLNPGRLSVPGALVEVVIELAIGAAGGAAIGFAGRALTRRLRLPAEGLYPAFTLAFACLAFAVPSLVHGSGFLAVYVAGLVLGQGELPYRAGIFRVHDALAWLSQIVMFLLLGLLVFPSQLPAVAVPGLVLGLLLALVARPVVAFLCLWPVGFAVKEAGYVGWVGLRGAVPIILAIIPVMAGAPGATGIFDVVFCIVVVNAIVPGATVPWVTRRLGLGRSAHMGATLALELDSAEPLKGKLVSFYVDDALAVTGVAIGELPLSGGSAVILLVRDHTLTPPEPTTVITPGDHVYLVVQPDDLPLIQLLFGRAEPD
jgi:potassium/hydrogen antiporter